MSVALKHISEVIEALTVAPQGATSSEISAQLNMGRQAATRLLDAMVASGVAEKDAVTRRYMLGLRVYRWGNAAVARHAPAAFLRYEIAELADEIQHPVFYSVLLGADVITIERTQRRGRHTLAIPDYRRNPWHSTSSGRALAAFLPAERLGPLMRTPGMPPRKAVEADLENIRNQGYAASEAVRGTGYTLAAPILDETGCAVAAIGIGVNKLIDEERALITRKLQDVAVRASSSAGYDATLLNA